MEEEYDLLCPPRCVSYLRARDPSILSWNRQGFEKVRQNLDDKFSSESTITVPSEKQDQGISVYLRIKGDTPDNGLYTIQSNTLTCTLPHWSHAARNNRDKTVIVKKFTFTSIFGPESSQEDIFDTVIKNKVLSFINGYNSTLLAYGASGSGKTFTMIGTEDRPGIIPRSLDYLFRTLPKSTNHEPILKPTASGVAQRLSASQVIQEKANLQAILQNPQAFAERNHHLKTYNEMQRRLSHNQVGILDAFPSVVNIWVSIAEIYNEHIYDLLQPLPGRGQHRLKLKLGGLQDDTFIRGLKYIYVKSGLEAYQVLQYGLHNLSYAATAVNQHSSRSHCIFSVRLLAGNDENNCRLSVFNFCDLAGSERLKKTMNEGDRLKESTKINTSLSVLGRCISSIRDMQHNMKDSCNAPFRESKLTQLFQKALQGKEDILMMVNINPSEDMFDDTQHALNFSAIAKQITSQEEPPKILKPNRFSSYHQNMLMYADEEDESEELMELRDERARLVLQLSEFKQQADKILEEETTHLRTTYDRVIVLKDRQIADLRREVDELRLQTKELANENKQLEMEAINAKEEVVVISSDEESDISNGNINLKNNNNLKDEIAVLKSENEMLSNKCEELEEILRDAKDDFNKLTNEYEALRSELTVKNVTLEDRIFMLNRELLDLRQRNQILTEENEKLEDQRQETRNFATSL